MQFLLSQCAFLKLKYTINVNIILGHSTLRTFKVLHIPKTKTAS